MCFCNGDVVASYCNTVGVSIPSTGCVLLQSHPSTRLRTDNHRFNTLDGLCASAIMLEQNQYGENVAFQYPRRVVCFCNAAHHAAARSGSSVSIPSTGCVLLQSHWKAVRQQAFKRFNTLDGLCASAIDRTNGVAVFMNTFQYPRRVVCFCNSTLLSRARLSSFSFNTLVGLCASAMDITVAVR